MLVTLPFLMDISYCLDAYMRAIKPVIHIFIGVNRMTCVLMPVNYSEKWTNLMPLFFIIIALFPFLIMWNTLISEKFFFYAFGGVVINYHRKVSWASLSFFNFLLILTTVAITLVTTIITMYRLSTMKTRLKSTERTLCIATALISIGFLLEATTQSLFAFFKEAEWMPYIAMYFQLLSYDVLNVGSPLIMILVSKQLRLHVFFPRRADHSSVSRIAVSVSLHTKNVPTLREHDNMSPVHHITRHQDTSF